MTPGALGAIRLAAPVEQARRRQLRVIVELELRKRLTHWRSLWLYGLATVPLQLMLLVAFMVRIHGSYDRSLAEAIDEYAIVFEPLILRAVVYLGCVGVFTALFRAEILQGSLHYLFLAPLRRADLVLGKYLAGISIAAPVFGLGALLALIAAYVPFMPPGAELSETVGLLADHGLRYLAVVVLACMGYGAVFLFAGIVFRNPIIPAATILVWEYINFLLPPALKAVSIIHYLRPLLPVPVSEGPFALLSDPLPIPLALAGLLTVTTAFLMASIYASRRAEIDYGSM